MCWSEASEVLYESIKTHNQFLVLLTTLLNWDLFLNFKFHFISCLVRVSRLPLRRIWERVCTAVRLLWIKGWLLGCWRRTDLTTSFQFFPSVPAISKMRPVNTGIQRLRKSHKEPQRALWEKLGYKGSLCLRGFLYFVWPHPTYTKSEHP